MEKITKEFFEKLGLDIDYIPYDDREGIIIDDLNSTIYFVRVTQNNKIMLLNKYALPLRKIESVDLRKVLDNSISVLNAVVVRVKGLQGENREKAGVTIIYSPVAKGFYFNGIFDRLYFSRKEYDEENPEIGNTEDNFVKEYPTIDFLFIRALMVGRIKINNGTYDPYFYKEWENVSEIIDSEKEYRYVVLDNQLRVMGVFRDFEEVMEFLETLPNELYTRSLPFFVKETDPTLTRIAQDQQALSKIKTGLETDYYSTSPAYPKSFVMYLSRNKINRDIIK